MSKSQHEDPRREERDEVTEASMESFPASDPPAFNASKPAKRRRKKASAAVERSKATANGAAAQANGADPERLTTAEVRGRIPSGRTMGVSSAAEPAAAPFDTDDEAAGRPAGVAAMRTTLAQEARLNGTRAPADAARPRPDATRILLIAGAAIAVLLVLAWLWLG